jgi:peptide/nickel transport system substrate-binding protein
MNGFVINSRRAPFDDWRVRDALIHAFDFERVNQVINGGLEPRIPSYFGNSELGMRPGPAEGEVRELLEPFADSLPPGALEGYALPVNEAGAGNRRNMRAAARLLAEAGWEPDGAGRLRNAAGEAFAFDILLRQGQPEVQAIASIYIEALDQLGITARVMQIDSAQYVERTNAYDFDMTHFVRLMSLSPGNEQWLYWGSEGVEMPGTRNLAGVDSPAVEAMITTMLETDSAETFTAATRALDRALMAGATPSRSGSRRCRGWRSRRGCIFPSACQFTATGRGSCRKSGGTRNDDTPSCGADPRRRRARRLRHGRGDRPRHLGRFLRRARLAALRPRAGAAQVEQRGQAIDISA